MGDTIVYKTKFSFWHHIVQRPGLVDIACLKPHKHCNAEVIVEVENYPHGFMDFKDVKVEVNQILSKLKAENDDPNEKPEGEYTINIRLGINDATAEWLTTYLHHMIQLALMQLGHGKRRLSVLLQETEKYAYKVSDLNG